jgi:Resolvase, N terminal domain
MGGHTKSPLKTMPGNARIHGRAFLPDRPVNESEIPMRVALYLRVSTSAQTVANQERELGAVAAARGRRIVETYRDEGISGAKGACGSTLSKKPSTVAMVMALPAAKSSLPVRPEVV